jgi:hypothetical protein
MWKKKLVTLAGVLGILACGACFLPPPHPYHPPPPPPLRASLRDIRNISVEAVNESGLHHLNPADLAAAVARDIDFRRFETHIGAAPQGDADPDARLQITITDETATQSEGSLKWFITITVSAKVTARDGRVLWSDSHPYSLALEFPEKDPDQVLQRVQIRNWLAGRLMGRMLHGDYSP